MAGPAHHRGAGRLLAATLTTAAVALSFALAAACGTTPSGNPGAGSPRLTRSTGIAESLDPILPDLVPTAELVDADSDEVHATVAPAVPPAARRDDQRRFAVHLEVTEALCPLDPVGGTWTEVWGYRIAGHHDDACGSPGPVLRGRVGDLAVVTLTNPATNQRAHNIDFHAVTGPGGGAANLTVGPGETRTIAVRLLYPGAFMYHCAFGDVPRHIAHGMSGMFIVDPAEPLHPVDHEWAVVQSEWYVGPTDDDGEAHFDPVRLFDEAPRFLTLNGRTDALVDDRALRMAVGERARIYLVNAGLNLASNWHPIGSHWDVVWPEGATHPANRTIRGSQSTLVVAGGGTVTELVGVVPSTVLLVDHALVRTFAKGLVGHVVIAGLEAPEVYAEVDPDDPGAAAPADPDDPPVDEEGVEGITVVMPDGAWNPANAATAYLPGDLEVPVGTTVTWRNDDTVVHTVTSGPAVDNKAVPDGVFDSGDIPPGGSFSWTFDEPGRYPYHCAPHPWMAARILVTG